MVVMKRYSKDIVVIVEELLSGRELGNVIREIVD